MDEVHWETLWTLVNRFELAALLYERFQAHSVVLPADVLVWLEKQHAHTINRNAMLLDELNKIILMLGARGIPALALKGPVLACLSTGLSARRFNDLDLLVRPQDLNAVTVLLAAEGFGKVSGGPQGYHDVLVRHEPGYATIVEVHFDLVDQGRSYTPDIDGLWERSIQLDVDGRVITTLSLVDHLLVAMMQLPHHHWNLRLLTEIATLVHREKHVLDWDTVIERASAWGMRALTGSTLHVIEWLFSSGLPEAVTSFVEPTGYFRRLQWQIVKHAVLEQLDTGRLTTARVASLLVTDRFCDAISLIARRTAVADPSRGDQTIPRGIRHLTYLSSNLPLLVRLLAEAAVPRGPAESWFARTERLD